MLIFTWVDATVLRSAAGDGHAATVPASLTPPGPRPRGRSCRGSFAGVSPDPGHDLVGALTRYLAEERVDAAASARSREWWLRQAADEDATLVGVLVDLAERAEVVAIRTLAGRTHRGQVGAVGEDFVALATGAVDVFVRLDALAAVRPGGTLVRGSDRPRALALTLAEALAVLAGDRPDVLAVGRDGVGTAGELRSVGRDVLTLRLAEAQGTVYLPVAAVAEVVVPA